MIVKKLVGVLIFSRKRKNTLSVDLNICSNDTNHKNVCIIDIVNNRGFSLFFNALQGLEFCSRIQSQYIHLFILTFGGNAKFVAMEINSSVWRWLWRAALVRYFRVLLVDKAVVPALIPCVGLQLAGVRGFVCVLLIDQRHLRSWAHLWYREALNLFSVAIRSLSDSIGIHSKRPSL